METSIKPSRALGGIVSSASAGVLSLVSNLILLPIILKAVGADKYGVWLVVIAMVGMFYFSDFGMGSALSHFSARYRGGSGKESTGTLLATAIIWNAVMALILGPAVLIGLSFYLSGLPEMVLNRAEEMSILWIVGFLILGLLTKPFSSALVGSGQLVRERQNQAIGVFGKIALTIVACVFFQSLVAIAIAEAVALVLPSLLSAGTLLVRMKIWPAWRQARPGTARQMLGFSLRSFSVSSVGMATMQTGTIALGILGTPSDVTVYNAGFRIFTSIRQMLTWMNDPLRPALSRLFASDPTSGRTLALTSLAATGLFGGIGAVALGLILPIIVPAWLGAALPTGQVVLVGQLLLAGVLLNLLHMPLAAATDSAGRPGVLFPGQVVWLVAHVVTCAPLIHSFGPAGAAISLVVPLILVEPIMLLLGLPALGIKLPAWLRHVLLPMTTVIGLSGLLTFGLSAGLSAFGAQAFVEGSFGMFFIVISALALWCCRNTQLMSSVKLALKTEL